MTRNFLLCTAFLLVSFFHAEAQQSMTIDFTPDGRMISFPKSIVRQHAHLHFRVKGDVSFVRKDLNVLVDQLEITQRFLDTTKISADAYNCLLDQNVDRYKKILSGVVKDLKSADFCNPNALDALKRYDVLKLKEDSVYFPLRSFIDYVFNKRFEIKVYNGTTVIDSFFLAYTGCKKGCSLFEGASYVPCRSLKKYCMGCPVDSISFRLVAHLPLHNALNEWIKNVTSRVSFDQEQFKRDFTSFKKDTANCDKYRTVLADIAGLKPLITRWLWYTGGKVKSNPLITLSDNDAGEKKKTISELMTKIANERELVQFMDSAKVKLKAKIGNEDDYKKVQAERNRLTGLITDDSTKLVQKNKDLERDLTYIGKLATLTTPLYAGTILFSRMGQHRLQKQFDAAVNYRPIYRNRRDRERLEEVPEGESVYVIIHNADSSTQIKLDEKRLAFDDQEKFTQLVNEQLSKIDFSSLPAIVLPNMNSFFTGLTSKYGLANDVDRNQLVQPKCECIEALEQVTALYQTASTEHSLVTPTDVFKPGKDPQPLYTSLINPVTEFEAPYRDSMTLRKPVKKDTLAVGKTFVKVGALRYLQLAAGVAFQRSPVYITRIDTSGNGFKVSSTSNAAAAILGFKFYPQKNYNRDNSLLPRYPLRRLSIFGAFDMIHPLNNFYLGGGYDVVPGLAFNTGWNFYQRTTYTVQNNQIVNTTRAYHNGGTFYAVTINPVLFIQVVKLFFTK